MRGFVLPTALSAVVVLATFGVSGGAAGREGFQAKIAFACRGDICIMNADGSGNARLTRDRMLDSYPVWSPDGHRIAFTVNVSTYRGDRTAVEVMNADGSGRRRLTANGRSDAFPAWSPDGSVIALDDNRTGKIALLYADGRGRRSLTRGPGSLPSWSPDGTRIAFVSGDGRRLALTSGDIYLISREGRGRRLLVHNGSFPVWSPNGREIVFLRNKPRWSNEVGVWLIDTDGTNQRRIWSHAAEGGGLSWSTDATRIALTAHDQIYLIGADGSNPHQLTRGWDVSLNPSWQPIAGARTTPGIRTYAW